MSQVGHLEVLAQKVGADTTFSRILYLVAEAQDQKPKVQRMLDRFAAWYTPLIISLSVALYFFTRDIELSLTFLVIGCPGALVVASPVAVVAGLGHAARKGILIKGGERLERIGKVDVVAFDKTGTLTLGRPRVSGVEAFVEASCRSLRSLRRARSMSNEGWVTALAAAAELRSEHHLAKAILDYAKEQEIDPVEAREWALLPGLGAVAETEGGTVLVGNRRLLASRGVSLTPEQEESASRREARRSNGGVCGPEGCPGRAYGDHRSSAPRSRGTGLRTEAGRSQENRHAHRRQRARGAAGGIPVGHRRSQSGSSARRKGSGHTRASGCGTRSSHGGRRSE